MAPILPAFGTDRTFVVEPVAQGSQHWGVPTPCHTYQLNTWVLAVPALWRLLQ